jgi:hypothetical protein
VNASTGVVTGVAAGTATITYTVAGTGGCANATATRLINVNSNSTSSLTDTVCQGISYIFGNQILTSSGTYRDTIPSAIGCDSIITLNLVVLTKPQSPQISVSPTRDTLFASPGNNVTWYRNGIVLTGGRNGVLVITQNGIYRARRDTLIGARLCYSDSSNALSLTNVGFDSKDEITAIRVYPVPTSQYLRVDGLGLQDEMVRIRIFDLSGRQIQEGLWFVTEQAGQNVELDVSALSNGIYQLFVENAGDEIAGFVRFNVCH